MICPPAAGEPRRPLSSIPYVFNTFRTLFMSIGVVPPPFFTTPRPAPFLGASLPLVAPPIAFILLRIAFPASPLYSQPSELTRGCGVLRSPSHACSSAWLQRFISHRLRVTGHFFS